MSTTGNVFPGIGENVTGIGSTAWTSPGSITADDTVDATCNAGASGSNYLVARNFGLSIPANSVITGVTVRVEASEHSTSTRVLNARLQNDSTVLVGTGKTATINGTAKAIYTYGSGSDVWGTTLTPAIVNNANFGVRLWFTAAHDVRIDYVTLAVDYIPPATGTMAATEEQEVFTATGTVTVPVPVSTRLGPAGFALAAVNEGITGIGELVAGAALVDGSGTDASSGSGDLVAGPVVVHGSDSAIVEVSVATKPGPAGYAVAATPTTTIVYTGSGALVAGAAIVDGAAAGASSGSGGLVSGSAIVDGAGIQAAVGSGELVAGAAIADGSAVSDSTGSGELVAGAALADGSAVSDSVGFGALVSGPAQLDGNSAVVSSGSGALVAGAAQLDGAGAGAALGAGALVSGPAAVDGQGSQTATGSGALAAGSALVAGDGTGAAVGSGALAAGSALVAGDGTGAAVGLGQLVAGLAMVSGSAETPFVGSGELIAGAAQMFGVGAGASSGAGVLASAPASIGGEFFGITSATGGTLKTCGDALPLEGQSLYRFLQQWIAGMTCLDSSLVRPRFQDEPPDLPPAAVAWASFGIASRLFDTYPEVRHHGDGEGVDELRRNEELQLLVSFYDTGINGLADYNAALFRDATAIAQNRETLQLNGMGLVAVSGMTAVPSLVKQRWQYRVDIQVTLRRMVTRSYQVRNLLEVDGTIRTCELEIDFNT